MSAPIPFHNANAIPIIGQPVVVHGWFPTVLCACQCEAKTPLLIVGLGAIATCPACQRNFSITEISHDGRTGQGRIAVAPVLKPGNGMPAS